MQRGSIKELFLVLAEGLMVLYIMKRADQPAHHHHVPQLDRRARSKWQRPLAYSKVQYELFQGIIGPCFHTTI